MITAIEIEIYSTKIPSKFDFPKLKALVSLNNTSHDMKLVPNILYLPIQSLQCPLIFSLYYTDKELGKHEIIISKLEKQSRITENCQFIETLTDRKNITQRNTAKPIVIFLSIHAITEKPSQELINCLNFQIFCMKKAEKNTFSVYKLLDDSFRARNELQMSIDETIDQLESQISEKNQIINSIFKESNEIQKSLVAYQHENNEIKTKNNGLTVKLKELEGIQYAYNNLNLEFLVLKEENKAIKHEKNEIEIKYKDIFEQFSNKIQEFEEKYENYEKIIREYMEEKINFTAKIEELNKICISSKAEIENLKVLTYSQKNQILKFECKTFLLEKLEASEKSLKNSLIFEENQKNKLKEEISQSAKLFKDQISSFSLTAQQLSNENFEISEKLSKTCIDLNQKSKENNDLKQEIQKLQTELISIEQHVCIKEDKNKIIDSFTQFFENIKEENAVLREKIEEFSKNFNEIDQKHRNCDYLTAKLQRNIIEKEEEMNSLKEIVVELQNIKNYELILEEEPVDIAINQYLISKNLTMPFLKENKGVYIYGNKKVKPKLTNGKIFINVSGLDLTIEEFFEEHTLKEIERLEEKKKEKLKMLRPIPTIKKIENFKEIFSNNASMKENLGFTRSQHGSLTQRKHFINNSPKSPKK